MPEEQFRPTDPLVRDQTLGDMSRAWGGSLTPEQSALAEVVIDAETKRDGNPDAAEAINETKRTLAHRMEQLKDVDPEGAMRAAIALQVLTLTKGLHGLRQGSVDKTDPDNN